MDVIYQRCCGLDIHKKIVVACLITPGEDAKPQKEIRSFGAMTEDLLKLLDWLMEHQVNHVAMESTGVYWKPLVRHEALFVPEGMREPLLGSVAAGH